MSTVEAAEAEILLLESFDINFDCMIDGSAFTSIAAFPQETGVEFDTTNLVRGSPDGVETVPSITPAPTEGIPAKKRTQLQRTLTPPPIGGGSSMPPTRPIIVRALPVRAVKLTKASAPFLITEVSPVPQRSSPRAAEKKAVTSFSSSSCPGNKGPGRPRCKHATRCKVKLYKFETMTATCTDNCQSRIKKCQNCGIWDNYNNFWRHLNICPKPFEKPDDQIGSHHPKKKKARNA
jgi:hypothetical protein